MSILAPDRTGTMPTTVAGERGHTWFRVTGDLDATRAAGRLPLVVLHGGPGAAHDYTLAMTALADHPEAGSRAVVHYDQVGCGLSSHHPDVDPQTWRVELFVDELDRLLAHLGIDRLHLLGQSWGGMLGPEVVLARPAGIETLTICDSPASMPLWLAGAAALRAELPDDVRRALDEHEAAGTTDHPAYAAAEQEFYARHVCRVQPMPTEVAATFAQLEAEPTVYHAMNGPNEFHVIGSMRTWSIVERLDGVRVPTLVVAGAHDEATPATWAPFVERVPDVRSHVFADSSHMPHVEEPEEFVRVVGGFLAEHDPQHDPQHDPATTSRSTS